MMGIQTETNKVNVWYSRFLSLSVLVTCFLSAYLSGGVLSGTTVFMVEFLQYFRQSRFSTSWISGIHSTLYFTSGPIWMIALKKMTHRNLLVAGVITSAAGLFSSAFTTSIYQLYFTYGFITGIGNGILSYTAIVYTGEYFTKKKYLAVGIVSTGHGVGTMVVPRLVDVFIKAYTWRGALMMLAAINLELAVFSFSIRKINMCDQAKNQSDIGDVWLRNRKAINLKERKKPHSVDKGEICSETSSRKEKITSSRRNSEGIVHESIFTTDSAMNKQRVVHEAEDAIQIKKDSLKRPAFKHDVVLLLKTWQLYAFGISKLLSSFCILIFMTFIMDYFISVGMSPADAINLFFLFGVGNFCGRLCTAFLAHYFNQRRSTFLLVAYTFFAVALKLNVTYTDYYLYTALSLVIGISYGCISACTPIVSLELFGTANARKAIAIVQIAIGVGVLCGPPIGGLIYDLKQDYQVVFTMCMGVFFLAAATIFPVICVTLTCKN